MKKIWTFIMAAIILSACNNQSVPADSNSGNQLENTHWKLTSLSAMPTGLPSLSKEVFLQMTEGKANGHAGCNSYFGGYTITGNEIHFTGVGSTKMFCQQGMEVENNLLQSLSTTDHYRISGKQLELLKGSEVLARFEAI
jgi:heat shock protein HslJ